MGLKQWKVVGVVLMGLSMVAFSHSNPMTRYSRKQQAHDLLSNAVYFGLPGVYRVTRLGTEVSNSALPALRAIPQATYHHDLAVVALSLVLCEQFHGSFISERELRHQAGSKGVGQLGHFCDGVLVCADQRIAIEAELSKKGKRRREQIMQHYLKSFDYEAVWYFCGNQVVEKQLAPFLKTVSFLKLQPLSNFIGEPVSS